LRCSYQNTGNKMPEPQSMGKHIHVACTVYAATAKTEKWY